MTGISFTPFPILTTERLTLRQASVDDAEAFFALRSDKKINKYIGRQECKNVNDAVNFINLVNDNVKKNSSVYWVITLINPGAFAGTICLFDFSVENSSCEIGYELLTNFQGQGIMKEAAESVIDYAFKIVRLQKITAFTHNANLNSTKLLEKLNFVKSPETDKENPDFSVFNLSRPK